MAKNRSRTIPKKKHATRKATRKTLTHASPATIVGRINTHQPNGGRPASRAAVPEPTPVDLGPLVLPASEDAVRLLKELAELNDRALVAHARYVELKESAKLAKDKWENLAEDLQTRLRVSTHASDLPLFDAVEREADQIQMEAAPETIGDHAAVAPGFEVDADRITDEQIPF